MSAKKGEHNGWAMVFEDVMDDAMINDRAHKAQADCLLSRVYLSTL